MSALNKTMNINLIKAPIISEKTNAQIENQNQYTFLVSKDASKGNVKDIIQELYKVKVVNVAIAKKAVKPKRSWVKSRNQFSTQSLKKAIVTLDTKDSIKLLTQGAK